MRRAKAVGATSAGDQALLRASFMDRLEAAERRDEESLMQQHMMSADALDAELLDGDDTSFADKIGTHGKHRLPADEDIQRVADLFWKKAASSKQKAKQYDSLTHVEGMYVIPDQAELDETTFCKLLALVQRPENGTKHSQEQQDGWNAAFQSIDDDESGRIDQGEIERFLARRRAIRRAERQSAAEVEYKKKIEAANVTAEKQSVTSKLFKSQGLKAAEEKRQEVATLKTLAKAAENEKVNRASELQTRHDEQARRPPRVFTLELSPSRHLTLAPSPHATSRCCGSGGPRRPSPRSRAVRAVARRECCRRMPTRAPGLPIGHPANLPNRSFTQRRRAHTPAERMVAHAHSLARSSGS